MNDTDRNHKMTEAVSVTHPPAMEKCFDLLIAAGAEYFCLFGGAVRDTECKKEIRDYDLRVWFETHQKASQFILTLKKLIHPRNISIEPCIGSDNVRYCFMWHNVDLDLSIRIVDSLSISAVAQERAFKADIGLSAVAIDATGQGWCRSEFISDRDNKTLTVYENPSKNQQESYLQRLSQKYPEYHIIKHK